MIMKKRFGIGRSKFGQVWVETVIYTLIGLAVIGLLLAVSKPKIDEIKDKAIIEQSITIMDTLNDKIHSVRSAAGNQRVVDVKIGKGRLVIDNAEDSIYMVIDNSRMKYSEPGVWVPVSGHMQVKTEAASPWTITLKMEYVVDIRHNNETTGEKEFSSAPTPYSLNVLNMGTGDDGNIVVNIFE
jgi:hypothetical protein